MKAKSMILGVRFSAILALAATAKPWKNAARILIAARSGCLLVLLQDSEMMWPEARKHDRAGAWHRRLIRDRQA